MCISCRSTQKVVLSKYHNGDTSTKIHRDINGRIGFTTIKRWWQMIRHFALHQIVKSIRWSTFRKNKGKYSQGKITFTPKERVSARKLSMDLWISERSVRRIMKNDLERRSYKKVIEPLLFNDQKIKRRNICKLGSKKFSKRRNNENSLFRWQILFTLMVSRILKTIECGQEIALMPIKKGAIKQKRKFPHKVMIWLGACSKGITPLVILDEGTVDHTVYIKKVLPVTLKYGNETFGRDWALSTGWCSAWLVSFFDTTKVSRDNFILFLANDCCPRNSPDLNRLYNWICDKLVNSINCKKVKSKTRLIEQLKSSFKTIWEWFVFESCTNRLYRMSQNDGNYLR